MRRRIPLPLVVIAAGMLAAAAGTGAATDTGNRAAARRDASTHVRALRLPAGAERRAAGKALPFEGDQAHALAAARWSIAGTTIDAVIAYVRAHPPAGARLFGTGSAGRVGSPPSEEELDYGWPPIPGRLGSRLLRVSASAVSGGVSVRAEAQSDWIVVRPRSERVPPGSRSVVVDSPRGSFAVTAPRKVRRIVALVDRLPAAQPLIINCPAEINPPRTLTLRFGSAARLELTVFGPWLASAWSCNSVLTFTVHGHRQPPLVGGHLIAELQRVLGRTLGP
jgi:hypothetical protein